MSCSCLCSGVAFFFVDGHLDDGGLREVLVGVLIGVGKGVDGVFIAGR